MNKHFMPKEVASYITAKVLSTSKNNILFSMRNKIFTLLLLNKLNETKKNK